MPLAIRILRRRMGLSQRAAAAQIRERTHTAVTQAMLSQWERQEQRPSLESLEGLLDGLGYGLTDLDAALEQARAQIEVVNEPNEEKSPPAGLEAVLGRPLADPVRDFERATALIFELPRQLEGLRRAIEGRLEALEQRLDHLGSERS